MTLNSKDLSLRLQGRYSSTELAHAIKNAVSKYEGDENALLEQTDKEACKSYGLSYHIMPEGRLNVFTFVCAMIALTSEIVNFTSYKSRANSMLGTIRIWKLLSSPPLQVVTLKV